MGKSWRWGVIIDAGSSGSRVYVYQWKDPAREQKIADEDERHHLPKVKTKDIWTKKIRPGISTFGGHAEDIGEQHLKELLDHALDIVPADKVVDTPFFLMATAGMRLLPGHQQRDILDKVCLYVREHTHFSLPDCHHQIQVIPGETEGLYGWIATNYLLQGFDHPEKHDHGKAHHTYGFLDMGGASAQIAFAPNSTETEKHGDDLKLLRLRTLNGKAEEYRVFTTTWLGFGVNQARERYISALKDKFDESEKELPDPCLPKGILTTEHGDLVESASADSDITLVGTGDFQQCLVETYPLLGKDMPCENNPCLLNGQHVPAIDFDVNHFIGVSEYWHTTHGVFGESSDKAGKAGYDFDTYQRKVLDFCSLEWTDIANVVATHKKGKNDKAIKNAQEACFKASWLLNVMHDGIGIPRVGLEHGIGSNSSLSESSEDDAKGYLEPFQPVNKIDHMEVSWTLGPIVLYASGQVPPSGAPMPVGFGSNVKGIPTDFQYAGSNYTLGISDESSWGDTADDILETATSSSGPSICIFVIVMLVLAFLLWPRDRRRRLMSYFCLITRRRRKPGSPRKTFRNGPLAIANKIFGGRRSAGYERVMEAGESPMFEFGDIDSDDSLSGSGSEGDGSHLGRTSGLATPTLNMDSRFDDIRKPMMSGGLSRAGLSSRTESRERLIPPQMLGPGRRSRASSPTRLKSPLKPTWEDD